MTWKKNCAGNWCRLIVIASLGLAMPLNARAQISYSAAGGNYTQNFDNLFTTVPANNTTQAATVLPAGWTFSESGTNANTTLRVDNGSSGTGDTFLYGATSSNERAFGSYASGSLTSIFGAQFVNNTGGTLNQFTLTFDGEQWRDGGSSAAILNTLSFSYSLTATSLAAGTYTNDTGLNFTALVNNMTADAAKDGNAPSFRTAGITKTISGITWAAGTALWIRWSDVNDPGNDDGLAIDNVVFSAATSGNNATWNVTSGTWEIGTGANWTGATGTVYTEGDNVVFANPVGGTVTMNSNVAPSSTTVSAAAGTYAFTGTGSINGTGALTKSGNGILDLSGLSAGNGYTGGTSLNGGTIIISNDNQLGATSGALSLNGGTLSHTASFSTDRAITVNANGGTIATNGNNYTTTGVANISGTLTTTGTGNVTLAGTSLTFGSNGKLVIAAGGAVTLANATGTVSMSNGGSFAGDLIINSTARFNFDGAANTYGGAGNIYVLGSALGSGSGGFTGTAFTNFNALFSNLSGADAGTIASNIIMNPADDGGRLSGHVAFTPGDITTGNYKSASFLMFLAGTSPLTIGNALTVNGVISGEGDLYIGNNSQSGGGSGGLLLNAANTYAGNTLINNGGIIKIGANDALPATTNVVFGSLSATGNATLDLNGHNQQVASLSDDGAKPSGKNLTITNSGSADAMLTVSGSVTPGNGFGGILADGATKKLALVKEGLNELKLTGANTYTGGTTVNNGTLTINTGGTLGGSAGTLAINAANGITSAVSLNVDQTVAGLSGTVAGTGTATLTINSGNTLTVNQSASSTFTGVVAGGGGLTKSGAGELSLSGVNTYAGQTNVNAGTLTVNGSLANTAVTVTGSGSQLKFGNAATLAGSVTANAGTTVTTGNAATIADGLTLTGGTINPGGSGAVGALSLGSTLSADGAAVFNWDFLGTSNFDTISLGSNALTLTGNPVLNLSGTNFAAGTYNLITYGSHSDANAFTLGTNPGGSFTYQLNTTSTSVTLTVGSAASSLKWDVGGGGSPVVDGAGSWGNASPGNSNFFNTVTNTTATFNNGNSFDVTFGNGGNGGIITLTSNVRTGGKLYFQAAGATKYTLGAVGGTFTLTTVGDIIANESATINAPVILEASQTWNVAAAKTITVNGTVGEQSAGLALTKIGAGTLILNGTASYTGGTNVNAGTLQGTTDSLKGNITNLATLIFDQTTSGNYADQISGTGNIVKSSSGTVTLTGNNTYSGGTVISGGTLALSGSGTLGSSSGPITVDGPTSALNLGAMSVNAGGVTLKNGGTISNGSLTASALSVESGSISADLAGTNVTLTKTTSGTVALSGNNSFTGGVALNGGVLQVASDSNLGTGDLTFGGGTLQAAGAITMNRNLVVGVAGGTLNTNGNSAATSGTITLNGNFVKAGAGDFTLTGGVTLNAGGALAISGGSLTLGQTSGNVTLVTDNTGTAWAGDLVVTGGTTTTLRLNLNTGSFSGGGQIIVQAGSTVSIADSGTALTSTIGNNIVLNNSTTNLGATSGNAITINGVISGASAVNLAVGTSGGAGLLTLNAANTYTGATTINNSASGIIRLGVDNALPVTTTVTFGTASGAGPGTLDLNGKNQQLAGLATGNQGSAANAKITNSSATADSILTINGTASPAAFAGVIQDGATHKISLVKQDSGTLILSGTNTYTGPTTVTAGTLQIGDGTTGSIATSSSVTNNANLNFLTTGNVTTIAGTGTTSIAQNIAVTANRVQQGTLTLDGGASNTTGKLTIKPSASTPAAAGDPTMTSQVSSLNIANNGTGVVATAPGTPYTDSQQTYYATLDLTNNDLIVTNGNLAAITDEIRSGAKGTGTLAAPAWNGVGITSSVAASVSGTALGAINNVANPVSNTGGPMYGTFDGQALTGNEILVKYTWYGDLDLDGTLTSYDFALLDAGFAGTKQADGSAGWFFGDLNYDGVVDSFDYAAFNSGYTGYTTYNGGGVTLPEPSALVMVCLGFGGLLAIRRQRKTG